MKQLLFKFTLLFATVLLVSCAQEEKSTEPFSSEHMMIRIAAIEIEPEHLDAYLTILKEESEASVSLEPGVICIYPMFEKERPAQIRLLEVYADKAAYEAHLKSPHFIEYKTSTAHMVKSLELIEMSAIDEASMPNLFRKLNVK